IPAPDADVRKREAAVVAAELARIEQRLDGFEPLAQPGRDAPTRPMVNPGRNVERFAPIPARMVRMTILSTSNGIEPCIDELEVYTDAAGDSKSRSETGFSVARNVALAAVGGVASASSEYPNSEIHKIAHLNDGRYGNGRSWMSRVPGRGVVTVTWPE